MRSFGRLFGAGALGALVATTPFPSHAQQPGNAPRTPTAPPSPMPDVSRATSVSDMMAATPGGLTADQVGQRAMATSYQAKAAQENLSAATARAEQQWVAYLPRLGLTARYTRLSDFTPPTVGGGSPSVNLVVSKTAAPLGPTNPADTFTVPSSAFTGGFSFPLVLDQWLTQATIAIPISDYFLRIGKAYSAATQSEDAARYDIVAAKAKSYSDGKIAYFTWLRARGAVGVTEQSLAQARAQLKDAENQFNVGNASKADVLRAQTLVASRELSVERAKSGVVIAERQVRVAIHARDEEALAPGDTLEGNLPGPAGQLKDLVAEAQRDRAEVKSIDKSAEAARKLVSVQSAGKIPTLSAFGDLTYANPNPRRFPAQNEWFATWSLGAQITWSPNDFLVAGGTSSEATARAAALDAQRNAIRDGIDLEVTQAYQAILEADTAVTTTQRQLESALEGYRVARELFNNGRGTGTTVIDAESALAAARLEHLNARVDARVARVRLEHAVGRDTRGAAPTP